jgi:HD-GYP domain-containing protein (c-di-GMP phosphodiesterase class II)
MKKIISIDCIEVGMYVSRVTKSTSKLVVKSQGLIKSEKTIESLIARGILELEIDLDKNDGLSKDSKSEKTTLSFELQKIDFATADLLYTESREIHKRFISQLKNEQAPDFKSLQSLSQNIIDSVFENPDALSCLVMLKESSDYLVEHSLNCSILMSLFAKHKGYSETDIQDLTLAGLLMDSGMALLPPDLITPTDTYTPADILALKTHVDLGVELVKQYSELPPVVLDIIANHHERVDGSGYPKQKVLNDISVFAKMAAIVDSYDDLITERIFKSSTSTRNALEKMQKDEGLDSELVNDFIKVIGLFPVGSLVHLKSERLAIVVQRNRKDPLQPIVMAFYHIREKHPIDVSRIDLHKQEGDKIIGSVRPEEFDINLPAFFRGALFAG